MGFGDVGGCDVWRGRVARGLGVLGGGGGGAVV